MGQRRRRRDPDLPSGGQARRDRRRGTLHRFPHISVLSAAVPDEGAEIADAVVRRTSSARSRTNREPPPDGAVATVPKFLAEFVHTLIEADLERNQNPHKSQQ